MKVLVVAPHLSLPPRDGGDIYVWEPWSRMAKFIDRIEILSRNEIITFRENELFYQKRFENKPRSKLSAALRTILFRSHYFTEKFITDAYSSEIYKCIQNNEYDAIVFSFLGSVVNFDASFINDFSGSIYILTHNDEPKMYNDLYSSYRSVLGKYVAFLSAKKSLSIAHMIKSNVKFIHINTADQKAWLSHIGPHSSIIVPAGAKNLNFKPVYAHEKVRSKECLESKSNIKLIFVGSLGVKMNYDAMKFFADEFIEKIRSKISNIDVIVVGSNPTKQIKKLCNENNFDLFADVSDVELEDLYASANFAILPFPYSNGSKLKLIEALSRGVPVLTTSHTSSEFVSISSLNLTSDNPQDWASHIQKSAVRTIDDNERKSLQISVASFDWDKITEKFFMEEFSKYIN